MPPPRKATNPIIAALKKRFEEAVTALSQTDIRRQLADELQDMAQGGEYYYLCDVFGDDQSGEVIISCNGDLKKAPYAMATISGKRSTSINLDAAVDVLPRTVYDEEADEGDHMTYQGAMESRRTLGLFERFISKDERAGAGSSEFAGKNKSFPILKAGDVMAAVRSIGRAGSDNFSADVLKKNIIRIAKRKGFTDQLPDAWKGDSTEAAADAEVESFIPLREGAVGQDGTAFLKLIAPGWGSSGHYSREMLKRDGPKIFKSGTKNFWNHQTATEEAERPEGDLRDLASVLTEDAHWEDNGPAGPGLYAKANVFPAFREHVDSLAKSIGVSIRAFGSAKQGTAEGRKGPIIEQLTRAQSVDYVTSPGAGGQVLQLFEAARAAAHNHPVKESDKDNMDEAQVQRLIETAVNPLKAENLKLNQRLVLATQAPRIIAEALATVRLPEATKARLNSRLIGMAPLKENGDIDGEAFKKIIEAEIKDEGVYLSQLTGGRVVEGMGAAPAGTETDPAKIAEAEDKAYGEALDNVAEIFMGEGDAKKESRKLFREGRAA